MPGNGVEGYYSLVFAINNGEIYCCKWTIEYQKKEKEPMCVINEIEAYNLFMERYFGVSGPMEYPEPNNSDHIDLYDRKNSNTFKMLGAVERCEWQGINRDTLIRPEEYEGKTAEEVLQQM